MVVDGNTERWSAVIQGYAIKRPDKILEYSDCFDMLVIGSTAFSEEIKERLWAMGLKNEEMLTDY